MLAADLGRPAGGAADLVAKQAADGTIKQHTFKFRGLVIDWEV
jgi:hypothetical protein